MGFRRVSCGLYLESWLEVWRGREEGKGTVRFVYSTSTTGMLAPRVPCMPPVVPALVRAG